MFLTVIAVVMVMGLVGCTDVVPKVSVLRGDLDGSTAIQFNPFVPAQNPAIDYSEKTVTVFGAGFSSYKFITITSLQSCAQVDFTNINESPAGKFLFTPTSDGAYIFCVIGRVASTGKWQSASQAASSAILEVDTLAPAAGVFTAPSNGSYVNSSNFSAFLFSGTCKVGSTVLFDSKELPCVDGNWSVPVDFTSLADGPYAYIFKQRNRAGNISPPATVNITKDTIAPNIPSVVPANGSYINSINQAAFNINGSCESGSKVKIQYSLATVEVDCISGVYNKSLDLTTLPEVASSFTFTQADPAGNTSAATVLTYMKDVTSPSINLGGLPISPSGSESLIIAISGSTDLSTYKYKMGPSSSINCSVGTGFSSAIDKSVPITNTMTAIADGAINLCILSTDLAGNTSSLSASWIKDTVVSSVKISERERTVDTGSGVQFFTVELNSAKLYDVTISLKVGGDAIYSTDHTLIDSKTVTIPAGQLTKQVSFSILNNAAGTGYSALKVKIAGTSTSLLLPDNLYQSTLYIKYAGNLAIPTMVSNGNQHTCAILNTGKIKCWGDNSSGQLGDGTTGQKSTPTAIDSSSSYQYISAGAAHTCAIKTTTNQLFCWGSNTSGELGFVGTASVLPTLADSGLTYSQVSASAQGTCGITTDNYLKCWGSNSSNQLGPSGYGTSISPTVVDSGYTFVSLGATYACALLLDGTLKCWGSNIYGQLGDGSVTLHSSPQTTSDASTKYSSVSVGAGHTCGLEQTTGVLKCWGLNNYGQLGVADFNNRTTPTVVSSGTSFAAVWTGSSHTCALTRSGQMKCWGYNAEGQLMNGLISSMYIPSDVNPGDSYISGSAGYNTSCGITSTNILKCGGSNTSGQVGDSTIMNKRIPSSLGLTDTSTKIATGFAHTCLLSNSGALSCAGLNAFGQLGDGGVLNHVLMTKIDPTTIYIQLAANFHHTCAITVNNKLKCWGRNDKGQLGDGSQTPKYTPTFIDATINYSLISAGTYHTCGITDTNALKCWGSNSTGQIGDGTLVNVSTPKIIDPGVSYKKVSVHNSHSCAITTDNVLKCWGDQNYGKQGDGATSGAKVNPTVVDSGVAYSQVTTGYDSTCAITTAGELKCFGQNVFGQIGNGGIGNVTIPTTIDAGVGYSRIFMGQYHTCGITTNNVAKCWGSNESGQIGNSSLTYQALPQVIDTGVTYAELALGYNHTCGITTSGTAKCWGNNNNGQYGDGGIPSHWRIPLNIMKWLVP